MYQYLLILLYAMFMLTFFDICMWRKREQCIELGIEWKFPNMKKLKGVGNFPLYFDNDDVTYIKMPNFGSDIGQEEFFFFTSRYIY